MNSLLWVAGSCVCRVNTDTIRAKITDMNNSATINEVRPLSKSSQISLCGVHGGAESGGTSFIYYCPDDVYSSTCFDMHMTRRSFVMQIYARDWNLHSCVAYINVRLVLSVREVVVGKTGACIMQSYSSSHSPETVCRDTRLRVFSTARFRIRRLCVRDQNDDRAHRMHGEPTGETYYFIIFILHTFTWMPPRYFPRQIIQNYVRLQLIRASNVVPREENAKVWIKFFPRPVTNVKDPSNFWRLNVFHTYRLFAVTAKFSVTFRTLRSMENWFRAEFGK